MREKKFIEEVFEIAFGDNAINRNFEYEEVIAKLKEFSWVNSAPFFIEG